MIQPGPLRLFISYAHKDDGFRRDLESHLSPLRRQGVLEVWSDRQIDVGQEWWPEIRSNLEAADLILLLISSDFLASDFCCERELKRAMERHEAGEACVIPVFLRPCDWKGAPFGTLQGVPDDAKPITEWENRDRAFTIIAQAIRRAAASFCSPEPKDRPKPEVTWPGSRQHTESQWPDFHIFQDAPYAPEIVVLPKGEFLMGSIEDDELAFDGERPQHAVRIGYRLAVGRYPVTFQEWGACVADAGTTHLPNDQGWGRERKPVINVSWEDAQQYLSWLSRKTGQIYRLLTEAEWEYAARSGTKTPYWWGDDITPKQANYDDSGVEQTTVVGSYRESPFQLCDMIGNVWEWTEDCWNRTYVGAPADGSAWTAGDCSRRVIRGGSWVNDLRNLRCSSRGRYLSNKRDGNVGFRVVRTLREGFDRRSKLDFGHYAA